MIAPKVLLVELRRAKPRPPRRVTLLFCSACWLPLLDKLQLSCRCTVELHGSSTEPMQRTPAAAKRVYVLRSAGGSR